MKIGVHVSISKSIINSIRIADNLMCDTFQIFTRNPRRWNSKELSIDISDKFKEELNRTNIEPVFSHMPYLANLASPDDIIWRKSVNSFKEELKRCNQLDIPYIVTHLGSPKNKDRKFGIKRILQALDECFLNFEGNCILLLENSTNTRKTLGTLMPDIFELINRSNYSDRLGICFDTCHAFTAGYDLRKSNVFEEIITAIDDSVGLDKLKLVHCNDSKFNFDSGRDQHEHIGLGKIGLEGFKHILKNRRIQNIPLICETPVDERRDDAGNIFYLRDLIHKLS